MKRSRTYRVVLVCGLLLLPACSCMVAAGGPVSSLSYTGSLAAPQESFAVTFVLNAMTTITIQTWGFGGGANAAGEAIPAGGFAPMVTLFSGLAASATLYTDTSNNPVADADLLLNPSWSYAGNCPAAGTVSIGTTNNCGDVKMQLPLSAGTYTLVLTAANYLPGAIFAGGALAQPFVDLTGGAASFQTCDVSANACLTRNGNFAVDIMGTGPVISPYSLCDLNQDGNTNASDVQRAINQALGNAVAVNDLNGDGIVNVVDAQTVVEAALGGVCAAK